MRGDRPLLIDNLANLFAIVKLEGSREVIVFQAK